MINSIIDISSYDELINVINADNKIERFNSRILFINNVKIYLDIVKKLSNWADYVVYISNFCEGDDVFPDIRKLGEVLENNCDKNILVLSIGEYLHLNSNSEKTDKGLRSIIMKESHSAKRVWIPIFSAEEEFEEAVGELDIRFNKIFYQIILESLDEFHVTVYSNKFKDVGIDMDAHGIKGWLNLWDNSCITKTNMSFTSRCAAFIKNKFGSYTIDSVIDPFTYISSEYKDLILLTRDLGNDKQWSSLLPYVKESNKSFKKLILLKLGLSYFNSDFVLCRWLTQLDDNDRWAFCLWYKLGFNSKIDYCSIAIENSTDIDAVVTSFECSIFQLIDDPNLRVFLKQRDNALISLKNNELGMEFWDLFENISDNLKKLEILSGRTEKEKKKIIDIVGELLNDGYEFGTIKGILENKFYDLYLYLSLPKYINDKLAKYIYKYKLDKISDGFDFKTRDSALDIDINRYDTRASVLQKIKINSNSYFIWVDGMGVEWLDLLLYYIESIDNSILLEKVDVCSAAFPTITKVNMSKADPETISESKYNKLDHESHVTDKSDVDYHSIILKQFNIIKEVADIIRNAAVAHPENTIVVTADHGLSRKAALAFHNVPGKQIAKTDKAYNHGRYCELGVGSPISKISDLYRSEDNMLFFKTYDHFCTSGYAPGEVHGGALPEECLVPVIQFKCYSGKVKKKVDTSFEIIDGDKIYRDFMGNTKLIIKILYDAENIVAIINGEKYSASLMNDHCWQIIASNLSYDVEYSISIVIDGKINSHVRSFIVKRRGLEINDDL